jgi:ADP-heptose:LPS heptosyltransferase
VDGLDFQNDVTGLARLIKTCDLVISIDNTTAHLSCALGVPTWVLLNLAHDWRWHVVQDRVYGYSHGVAYRRAKSSQCPAQSLEQAIKPVLGAAESPWEELLWQVAKDLQKVLAA